MSRLKKTLRASEQLRADVVTQRAAYLAEIQQIPAEDLVFIDESGVTTHMVRRFARALGGSRAIGRAPAGRYEKLRLIGAIALGALLALMTIPASTDSAVFLAFIQQVLVPELRPGQVVVFDNLSPHKEPKVRRAIYDPPRALRLQPFDFEPDSSGPQIRVSAVSHQDIPP